jgi:hypothetical protein
LVHNMDHIYHFYNVSKKWNLLIIMAEGNILNMSESRFCCKFTKTIW